MMLAQPATRGAQPLQAQPARAGFGLMPTAQAAAVRPAVASSSGGWAVQVGAFSTEQLARSAASAAASGAPGGRVLVQPVGSGRNTLYRARVTGLSQASANNLCDRLRARGGCAVISMD